MIQRMDGELNKIIEDFMHAVDVGALVLYLAEMSGKHWLPQSGDSPFSAVQCRIRVESYVFDYGKLAAQSWQ